VTQKKNENERDIERKRERDTERKRQTDRHTQRQTDGERDMLAYTLRERGTECVSQMKKLT
jgi:hypothetical protein